MLGRNEVVLKARQLDRDEFCLPWFFNDREYDVVPSDFFVVQDALPVYSEIVFEVDAETVQKCLILRSYGRGREAKFLAH